MPDMVPVPVVAVEAHSYPVADQVVRDLVLAGVAADSRILAVAGTRHDLIRAAAVRVSGGLGSLVAGLRCIRWRSSGLVRRAVLGRHLGVGVGEVGRIGAAAGCRLENRRSRCRVLGHGARSVVTDGVEGESIRRGHAQWLVEVATDEVVRRVCGLVEAVRPQGTEAGSLVAGLEADSQHLEVAHLSVSVGEPARRR